MSAFTLFAGVLAILVGQLAMIVIGFKTNPNLGCLLILLGPIMSLVFFVQNPERTAVPFAVMCAGYLVSWLSIAAMHP